MLFNDAGVIVEGKCALPIGIGSAKISYSWTEKRNYY